jgi:hypothetical protein
MNLVVRALLVIGGLLMLILAAGYWFQMDWAVATWLWAEKGVLTHAFVASMQAAIAAAMLWIGLSGELGALAVGALNLLVMMSGSAVYLFLQAESGERAYLREVAIGCALFATFNLLLFLWSRGLPMRDSRPTPPFVRFSYILFTLVLAAVGLGLLVRMENVLPWPLNPDTSVIFGWMFLGDAFYFAYALFDPRWHYACAQLWSFLAYDLVLLGPLLWRLNTTIQDLLAQKEEVVFPLNLIAYILVLLYSAILGIYYLFFNPATHMRASKA